MAIFRELKAEEIITVAGGQSIVEQLLERFPFGEFVGGTFYPNGAPRAPEPGPYTT